MHQFGLGFMSSMAYNNQMPQFTESNFFVDLSTPPLPSPTPMNCGELREHHSGTIVEMNGRVNRSRLGRFIELKDQYGVIQLVAPVEVLQRMRNFNAILIIFSQNGQLKILFKPINIFLL